MKTLTAPELLTHQIKNIMKEQSKGITVRIGSTIYPVENGWVMFGLGKPSNK